MTEEQNPRGISRQQLTEALQQWERWLTAQAIIAVQRLRPGSRSQYGELIQDAVSDGRRLVLQHDSAHFETPKQAVCTAAKRVRGYVIDRLGGRRVGRSVQTADGDVAHAAADKRDPGRPAVNPDWNREVDTCLSQIPEESQQILRLAFFEDMTDAEIGQQLNLSTYQIGRRRRKALEELRPLLFEAGFDAHTLCFHPENWICISRTRTTITGDAK